MPRYALIEAASTYSIDEIYIAFGHLLSVFGDILYKKIVAPSDKGRKKKNDMEKTV